MLFLLVPQNDALRASLVGKSLDELHQYTCWFKEKETIRQCTIVLIVDTNNRAIRAIEIETFELENPTPDRLMPAVDSIIIGVEY